MTGSGHTDSAPAAGKIALPAGVTVREFRLNDYDAALALWRACEGIGLNESDSREAIGRFLERNPRLSLVAYDAQGLLAGAVLCGHDGRRGYLHHLAVAASQRRKGLGRALVERCLHRLKVAGIPKCTIFLYASNTEGRAFWLRQGWLTRDDLVVVQRPLTTT